MGASMSIPCHHCCLFIYSFFGFCFCQMNWTQFKHTQTAVYFECNLMLLIWWEIYAYQNIRREVWNAPCLIVTMLITTASKHRNIICTKFHLILLLYTQHTFGTKNYAVGILFYQKKTNKKKMTTIQSSWIKNCILHDWTLVLFREEKKTYNLNARKMSTKTGDGRNFDEQKFGCHISTLQLELLRILPVCTFYSVCFMYLPPFWGVTCCDIVMYLLFRYTLAQNFILKIHICKF